MTNIVTTNDEGNTGEIAEAEANSENSNNSNNGIGRSISKSRVEAMKKQKKGTTRESNDNGKQNETTM